MDLRPQIKPLLVAFDRQPKTRDAFSARVSFGAAPSGGMSLGQPDMDTLADWLAAEVADVARPDDKLAAAYLINSLSWAVTEPLGWLALEAAVVPEITPASVTLTSRRQTWEEDGETGVATAYDMVIDPDGLGAAQQVVTPQVLGTLVSELFAPLVSTVAKRSGLSRGALWRLIGDGLSATLLAQGMATDVEDHAMEIARTVLADKASPLFSRQTGFVRVALPERPDIAEWFRARGGGCRYYTLDDGHYCTTCVLRDANSRDARLQAYLRRKNGIVAPEAIA